MVLGRCARDQLLGHSDYFNLVFPGLKTDDEGRSKTMRSGDK